MWALQLCYVKNVFGIDWVPFSYEKRLSDSVKANKKKDELSKLYVTPETRRTKLTTFVTDTLRSRKEDVPLVSYSISLAKNEPFHLNNNDCKEMFLNIWKSIFSNFTHQTFKSFSKLPQNSILYLFVSFVRAKMKLNKLARCMEIWFNETKRGI